MDLSDLAENDPRSPVSTRHDDPAEPMIQGLALRDQAGFVSAPVHFILRPATGVPMPVTVIGREGAARRAERARTLQRQKRFSDWVRLNPWGQKPQGVAPPISPWKTEPTKVGERIAATPAIVEDTLYVRTATKLYAFRKK